jgi:hypothetical protein
MKKADSPRCESMRGQPEIYDEVKKIASFCITPTAQLGLAQLSRQLTFLEVNY